VLTLIDMINSFSGLRTDGTCTYLVVKPFVLTIGIPKFVAKFH
jgi:hypothetical protein